MKAQTTVFALLSLALNFSMSASAVEYRDVVDGPLAAVRRTFIVTTDDLKQNSFCYGRICDASLAEKSLDPGAPWATYDSGSSIGIMTTAAGRKIYYMLYPELADPDNAINGFRSGLRFFSEDLNQTSQNLKWEDVQEVASKALSDAGPDGLYVTFFRSPSTGTVTDRYFKEEVLKGDVELIERPELLPDNFWSDCQKNWHVIADDKMARCQTVRSLGSKGPIELPVAHWGNDDTDKPWRAPWGDEVELPREPGSPYKIYMTYTVPGLPGKNIDRELEIDVDDDKTPMDWATVEPTLKRTLANFIENRLEHTIKLISPPQLSDQPGEVSLGKPEIFDRFVTVDSDECGKNWIAYENDLGGCAVSASLPGYFWETPWEIPADQKVDISFSNPTNPRQNGKSELTYSLIFGGKLGFQIGGYYWNSCDTGCASTLPDGGDWKHSQPYVEQTVKTFPNRELAGTFLRVVK